MLQVAAAAVDLDTVVDLDTMCARCRNFQLFLRAGYPDGMVCILVQEDRNARRTARRDRSWTDTWTFGCWPDGRMDLMVAATFVADRMSEQ